MEWVTSTLHTTSEHGVSSINTVTAADAHTSAASSRMNFRPRQFKWSRHFRRKTKSGFCACVVTFQTQSTLLRFWSVEELAKLVAPLDVKMWRGLGVLICLEMQCNKVSCND